MRRWALSSKATAAPTRPANDPTSEIAAVWIAVVTSGGTRHEVRVTAGHIHKDSVTRMPEGHWRTLKRVLEQMRDNRLVQIFNVPGVV